MTGRGISIAAACILGWATSPTTSVTAVELGAFLAEVEEMGAATTPVRASFTVRVTEAGGTQREARGAVVYAGRKAYVEAGEPAVRVLIPERGDGVLMRSAEDSDWRSVTAHDPIGTTTLIADDFRPFRAGTIKTPQVASETKGTILLNGAPAEPAPWVLVVYLVDREKLRAVRVQYYERTINNMVRMRRDDGLVRVGGRWRPAQSDIDDYRTGSSTTVRFDWQPNPTLPPGLFDARENARLPSPAGE